MGNLTIKDIAKMANVSPTLVSFVLNNKPGVSKESRKKIMDIIESTDFKPNIHFRRLTMKRSFNICLVIQKTLSPFNDFFCFELSQELLEQSEKNGYNIILATAEENSKNKYIYELIDRGETDGIIFYRRANATILEKVAEKQLPAVLIDMYNTSQEFLRVNADYYQGAALATKYLIDNGHREIALLSSSYDPEFNTQIFSGFCETMEPNGLSAPLNWLQINCDSEALAYAAMKKILESNRIPTAVVCAADMFAINAIRCVNDFGLSVPGDISFIGIDDLVLSKYVYPPLTTLKIDKRLIAEKAMDMILKKIDHQAVENEVEDAVIPITTVIERGTVKPLLKPQE